MTIIYHYCDPQAFVSIMQTGKFWVSDARKTNDRRELAVFKELAFDHIRELARLDASVQTFSSQLDFHFDAVAGISEYYVCCFSEADDSIPQWVAYGERGTGFAIGLDVNEVRNAIGAPILDSSYRDLDFEGSQSKWLFGKTIYAESGKKTESLLKFLAKLICNDQDLGTQPARDFIDRLCAFYKDQSFSSEQEWRIIYNSSLNVLDRLGEDPKAANENLTTLWRQGRYGLTPYICTPDLRRCIREIIIGPSNIDRATHTYVTQFLQSLNIECDVRQSKSPYR
ncbi:MULTISPECIES: DUF2971 domain-containing protein [Burkholderia]|uniref:DUF2971 domain-containing protein n=1 Tax=Burkholderia TaxID=32008 RepID=UPI00050DBA44|nr:MULTISPECIES: DUF2971 domain-containing protein [Burkholderia]KGC30082.1 hypothetical protein DO62_812 [Burkholderia pseudomallei]